MTRNHRGSSFALRARLHLVLVVGCGLAAFASFTGACYQPTDTLPNWQFPKKKVATSSTTGEGGTGGTTDVVTATGSGGGGIDCSAKGMLATSGNKQAYFTQCVLDDLQNSYNTPAGGMIVNCTIGNCHLSGQIDFLSPPGEEYSKITSYLSTSTSKSFLVNKDPEHRSRLMLYPQTATHAGGKKWKPEEPKDPLYPLYRNTVTWLELEAPDVVEDTTVEVCGITPKGFTSVPLAALAVPGNDKDPFNGSAIVFFAVEHSGTLLELLDLKVYPAPGYGLTIKDMGFKIVAPKQDPKNGYVDTSLYGDAQTFVAPGKVDFGSGQVLLAKWTAGSTLCVTFKSLTTLLADSHGNTFATCVDVPLFTQKYLALDYKPKNPSGANGLQYCGKQCHGGGDNLDPLKHTAKMDLLPIIKLGDYELGCAITRAFITPGNPTQTRIFAATEPNGASAHGQFQFGGNPGAWNAFKNTMRPWVCAESKTADCNGACVDIHKDTKNCGSCGNVCMVSGQQCLSDKCACPDTAKTTCNNTCVDTNSNVDNCGVCNMACGAGKVCVKGMCK